MPNYDLGIAHGKIKIDADTRGASETEAELAKLKGEVKDLTGKLHGLEDALLDYEGAAKSSGRSSRDFNADMQRIIPTVMKLQRAYGLLSPSIRSLYNDTNRFQNSPGLRALFNATPKMLILSSVLRKAGTSFLGLNKAIDGLGPRTKLIRAHAQQVLLAGAAYGALKRFGGPLLGLAKSLGSATGATSVFNRVYRELIGTAAGGNSTLAKTARTLLQAGLGAKKLGRDFDGSVASIAKTAGAVFGLTTGLALMKKGVGDVFKPFLLLSKIPKKFLAIGAAALVATKPLVEIGAKGLVGISNLYTGLVAGIKQLSGGALVIPGIIASFAAGISTIKVLGSALGKVFGDVFSAETPEDLAAAIDALPEHLRPVGKAVAEVKKDFDDLGKSLVDTFVQGGVEDAQQLSSIIKGPLTGAMKGVTKELQTSRSKLVDFLGESSTLSGVNSIFDSTRQTIGNITKALIPAGAGFIKLAGEGAKFVANTSGGLSSLADKFNGFVDRNTANGNITKWMQQARVGAVDLGKGLLDVGRTLNTVLGLFKSGNQSNFLEKFADGAKKLADATSKSADNGFLRDIADQVRSLGTEKLERFVGLVKDFVGLRKVFAGLFDNLSEAAFSGLDVAVTLLKAMLPLLQAVVEAFSFLTPAVGIVLGIAAAFKVLLVAITPIRGAITAVAGAFTALYAGGKLLAFLSVLEKFGAVGRAAAAGLLTVATAGATLIAGFLVAGAAIGGFYLAIRQGQKDIDAANDAFRESQQVVIDYGDALHQAFTDDGGLAGKNVFTATEEAVKSMNAALQNSIDKTPGILAGLTDSLNVKNASVNDPNKTGQQRAAAVAALRVGAGPDQSDNFKQLEDVSAKAEKAKQAFDKLNISSSDLAGTIQGNQTSFDNLRNLFKGVEGGDEAVAQLDALRAKFVQTQDDFNKAGPGAAQLSSALQKIGDAGSDATSKLEGLKSALAALGLDQTSAIENALNYADAIRKIGDEANSLVDKSAPLDNIFGPDGVFNPSAGANARNLFDAVRDAVTGFQRAVIDGKDIGVEFQKIQDSVPGLAQAFGTTEQNINGLVTQLGGVPDVVSILVNIKGGDKIAADLAGIAAKLKTTAEGQPIVLPFTADPTQLQKALDAALGSGVANVGANNIEIPAGVKLDPAAKQKFFDSLTAAGVPVQAPGAPPPANPIPVATEVAPPSTAQTGVAPPSPIAEPERAAAAGTAPTDTSQLDAALGKIQELQAAYDNLKANPPKVDVDPGQVEAIGAATEGVVAKFNAMKDGIAQAMAETQNIITAVAANLITPIIAAAGQAFSAGSSIGTSLAAGITSSTGAAIAAAENLAKAVADRMPHSPAKKGPLSGKGYPLYSGIAVGNSFAQGIVNSTGGVAKASGGMAGAVSGALNTYQGGNTSGAPGEKAGAFLGELSRIVAFGQQFVDVVDKIGKAVLGFAKFISDPLGKGTFFGKSAGAAFGFRRDPNVSDVDLQAKRDEALQSKLQGGAAKDNVTTDVEAQKQADAKKQAALNAEAVDAVVGGLRVAPLSEEEKKATKDGTKATTEKLTDIEKATKTQAQFDADTRQAQVDATAKLNALSPEELAKVTSGEISLKTQEQMLAELEKQTPLLGEAIDVSKKTNPAEDESIKALTTIQSLIDAQGEAKTPAQKQQLSALEGLQSTIKGNAGLTEGANPIDQAGQIAGAATSIAGDIFKSIQSAIEAVGATKDIADTLVRGVANTEDVFRLIDDFQKYIQLAADVAASVGSVLSAVGSFTGGSDLGITSAAGQAASLISGALEAVNATIDLAQEAYRIAGSYVGQFLGYLAGAGGSQLEGNVKFLLDTQTNQLLSYSTNNPQDKRALDGIGGAKNLDSRNQQIGTINVYGGPGSDPRDNTRQMMYQVRAAGFAGVGATGG